MNCPHCGKHIRSEIIAMSELVDDFEKFPWLLDAPELQEYILKLKEYLK